MKRISTAKQSPALLLALTLVLIFSCNTPSKTQSQLSKEAFTIRQLLTHTAGFTYGFGKGGPGK